MRTVATSSPDTIVPQVEPGERAWGAAVHVSSIFWPLLGPIVGWAIFAKKSRFVASHAKQALLETLVLNAVLFIVGAASFIYTVTRLWSYWQNNWEGFMWQEFLIRFIVGWILLFVLGVINTVVSVVQAVKAWKGELPRRYQVA